MIDGYLLYITVYYVFCGIFFFFQAEDGIRDFHVTGVQTCALPICLGTLALIAIRDGKSYAYAESVSTGAGRNLIDASTDVDIGNTLSILQANGCVSSTLT